MRQHGKVSEVTEKKTAVYVDDQQRILIRQLARGWLWRSELPTWLLIVTVYGGWFACVAGWRTLGLFPRRNGARYAIFIALITFISNGTSTHLPEFISHFGLPVAVGMLWGFGQTRSTLSTR